MKWHGKQAFILIFLLLVSWLSIFHFVPLVHAETELSVQINSIDDVIEITDLDSSHPPWESVHLWHSTSAYNMGYISLDESWYGHGERFNNVTIPNGATITSAVIQYSCASTTDTGVCYLHFAAENSDNASAFDGTLSNYEARSRTAYVNWTAPTWTKDAWENSTDISSIVQTVVNRAGWVSGNSIVIFSEDNGSSVAWAQRSCQPYGAGANFTLSMKLVVTYTSAGDVPEYDYVDSQTDVDSHADHGTHSSFTAEKATDWTNDSLIEANTNTTAINNSENFVDNNSSNVDSHTGHGTSSNFTGLQDANVLYNDTLTEANTGGATSDVFTDGFEDGTTGKWDGNGATTWDVATNATYSGWVTHSGTYMMACDSNDDGSLISDNIDLSGVASFGVSFWYMEDDVDDADEFLFQMWDGAAYDTIIELGLTATEDVWYRYSAVVTDSQYFDATFRFRFIGTTIGTGEVCYIDDVVINKTLANNYEMDYEFEWTTADYDEANEYLCIRTGDTLNGESLLVQVRDTTWKTILTIASADTNTWKNASLNGNLTGATITFRFLGNTESSDTTQSSWEIECALIHVWSVGVNYELDLEEQFSSANFSRTYVELCIRMGDFNTTENLQVDYWNASSSAWVTAVAALTENDWTNTSVKAYTSNASVAFTIRLLGTSESGDSERSLWDKDACLLHTWDALAAGLTAVLSASTLIPSTLQFLKELSFQGTQSTNIVSTLINNRAVPFSFDGLVAAISSVTQALALAFTPTGLTRIFGSLDFGKSLGFSHSGLLNVAGSLQNWQAKGFSLDGLVKALDYSVFNKGLLFSQTGTLQLLESLSVARALGLSFSELPKLFSSLTGNNALQFQATNTLLVASTSPMGKALGFLTTGLPKLFDSGTMSKEIAVMVSSFLASGNAQILDSLNIGKAFGFSQSGSIRLLDSSTMLKGLGFLSTNSLNMFGSGSFGKGLGFLNANSLNILASNGVGKALGFGLSGITNAWASLGVTQAHGFGLSNSLNAWTALATNKGMGFSLSQLVSIWDYGSAVFQISTGVARSFDLSGVVYAFGSGFFNKATGFLTTNTVNAFGSNAWNNAFGFRVTNALNALDYVLLNRGLGFLNTNTVSTLSTVNIGRSLGFSSSGLLRLFDSAGFGRSLGFTTTNTLRIFDTSTFNKALGFIVPNSLNVLGSLTLQRALGFQLTDIIRVFDFSGQGQSPSFILSTLLKVVDTSHLNRALGFRTTEVVRGFDYSIFTKALGFSNPETFKAFGSLQFGKALGFSTSELTRLFGSSSFGRSLAFSSANSLRIFDANILNKALGFTAQNTINLFSLNSINKGLGFSLPELTRLWVSISTAFQIYGGTNYPFTLSELTRVFDTGVFNKAKGFITSNSLNAWSYNFWNNAFGFQATGTLRLWDSNSVSKALGFNPSSILTVSSANVFNKALDFKNYGLINLFEALTYSFEIYQYIPQERAFIVTGLMQIFDGLLPTKAIAFTSTSTLRLFDYGRSFRAFGYTVTNTLQIFDSSTFLKALQFTTTNSLYPTSTSIILKALAFTPTSLLRLFDLATMNKANLYTTTETLVINSANAIGKSLTFLNTGTVNIFSNLEFNKEITIWFFEISEVGHVFATLQMSNIFIPVPANAALVLGMFGALMSFIAFAFVLVHRRRGEDED